MSDDLARLLKEFHMNPAAQPHDLKSFANQVGPVPDHDYLAFMEQHNGAEGPIGEHGYLCVWSLYDAVENTNGYRVNEMKNGLLLFATDGGDIGYAFDRSRARWPIVKLSLVSASPDDICEFAPNFAEFIKRLARDAS